MRLRNLIFGLFLAIGAIGFTACTGDDGATGPAGPAWPAPNVDDIVDEVIDELEGDMANPDNCTIFADRSRTLTGSNRDDVMCGNERNNSILGEKGLSVSRFSWNPKLSLQNTRLSLPCEKCRVSQRRVMQAKPRAGTFPTRSVNKPAPILKKRGNRGKPETALLINRLVP